MPTTGEAPKSCSILSWLKGNSHQFPKRQLGKDGPLVSEIGLGCMGLSAAYGPAKPEAEALELLNRAVDLGCNFLDSADIYGANEELLSKILSKRRSEIFVTSKFTFRLGDADAEFFPGGAFLCGKPEYVKLACNQLETYGCFLH